MHTDADPKPTEAATANEELRTHLGRPWAFKALLVIVVFLGLGVWGFVDAVWIYPDRGRKVALFAEQEYLDKAFAAGMRTPAQVSIEDPAQRFEELEGSLERDVDTALFLWLTALSRVEPLEGLTEANRAELASREAGSSAEPTQTLFTNPRERLAELTTIVDSTPDAPKPLNKWDIPVQWGICAIGGLLGLYFLAVFLAQATKSYRYDPAAKRLTMPGGKTIVPDDIEVFDKRKWDKYLVFLTLRGESGERKIDLYRYMPLEEWMLEMWAESPHYEPDEDEEEEQPEEPPAGDTPGEDPEAETRS